MKPKQKIILMWLVFIGLTASEFAFAALVNCKNDCTIPKLFQTILNIINFLLSWAYLVAIIFIVWGGWGMISANGNEEAISAAKTTFRNAIIGFFMVMVAFVLLNFVIGVLSGDGKPRAGALIDSFNLLLPKSP